MNVNIAMGLVGGLGLFIYGMQVMGDGLQKIAGDRMRKILEMLTKTSWIGAIVGTLVTAIIQSSSATTVMLVGFVNAGLLNLTQAIGVIMGANIGTTITAQMIAFQIDKYALWAIGLGFALSFLAKRKVYKFIGESVLGFGLLFFGLTILKESVIDLRNIDLLMNMVNRFGSQPLLGVLAGLLFTSIIQSSSATMGLVIAAAASGILNIQSALPIVLGAEIGTCVTTLLASIGTSVTARRAAMAHLLFNLFGTLLFLSILPLFIRFATLTSSNISRQIANAQTSLNIICTLIGLPIVGLLAKVVTFLVPGEVVVIERGPIYLDLHLMVTPSIALGQAAKEIARMAHLALEMLDYSYEALFDQNKKAKKQVKEREEAVDNLASEVTKYLTKISQSSLSPQQSRRLTILMHVVNDIERAADHADDIMQIADEKNDERIPFSKTANDEIKGLHSDVKLMFENILFAFETDNATMAKEYQEIEDKVDEIARNARLSHSERLKEGVCISQAGVIFLDIINHYERIADLANSLGYATRGEITKL